MTFHKFLPFLAAASAGCVSNDKPWVKNDTPQSDADQTLAECKYEAETATIGIGSGRRYSSYEDAIGSGIATGMEQEMDKEKLIRDCMTAKGFTQ